MRKGEIFLYRYIFDMPYLYIIGFDTFINLDRSVRALEILKNLLGIMVTYMVLIFHTKFISLNSDLSEFIFLFNGNHSK